MRLSTHETFKNAGSKTIRSKFYDCGTFTLSRLRHINRIYKYTSFSER